MRSALLILLCASAAVAEIKTKTVEYKDGDTVLEGYMAWDDLDAGKRAGVLIVHQWTGITDHERNKAKELAKLGYVAFAVDIYGKGVRPKNFQEARTESSKYRGKDTSLFRGRLAAGHKAMLATGTVDKRRVGAIGFCFGGTGVLELARSGADVVAVVSFHGGLGTPNPADAKNIKGKVLVLHGADDPFVPPEEVAAFMKEMRDSKVDWQFVAYGGAVHSFTQPEAKMAGQAEYHESAARRSWEAMRDFFNETLK